MAIWQAVITKDKFLQIESIYNCRFSNSGPKLIFLIIFIIQMEFFSQSLFGLELYRFVDPNCHSKTGLILNADGKNIYLLTTGGELELVHRKKIKHVLVYNTLYNPIATIHFTKPLTELLRNVFVTTLDKPSLIGWPIKFSENMIVFFDIEGKNNIVDRDNLMGINIPNKVYSGKISPSTSNVSFGYGNNLPECRSKPKGENSKDLPPTRMISDKIKVDKFLYSFEIGFKKLNKFQRRTQFYALPYLFEKDTLFGFHVSNKEMNWELPNKLPIFFKWSEGKPYSHQSRMVLGSQVINRVSAKV